MLMFYSWEEIWPRNRYSPENRDQLSSCLLIWPGLTYNKRRQFSFQQCCDQSTSTVWEFSTEWFPTYFDFYWISHHNQRIQRSEYWKCSCLQPRTKTVRPLSQMNYWILVSYYRSISEVLAIDFLVAIVALLSLRPWLLCLGLNRDS